MAWRVDVIPRFQRLVTPSTFLKTNRMPDCRLLIRTSLCRYLQDFSRVPASSSQRQCSVTTDAGLCSSDTYAQNPNILGWRACALCSHLLPTWSVNRSTRYDIVFGLVLRYQSVVPGDTGIGTKSRSQVQRASGYLDQYLATAIFLARALHRVKPCTLLRSIQYGPTEQSVYRVDP